LKELYADAVDEDEVIRTGSLHQLLSFFLDQPATSLPKITLTPDGTLRIRWLGEGGDFFAVEFTGKPLLKIAAAITRASGETSSYFASEISSRIAQTARALGASLG
jgi:hypothetical protein